MSKAQTVGAVEGHGDHDMGRESAIPLASSQKGSGFLKDKQGLTGEISRIGVLQGRFVGLRLNDEVNKLRPADQGEVREQRSTGERDESRLITKEE